MCLNGRKYMNQKTLILINVVQKSIKKQSSIKSNSSTEKSITDDSDEEISSHEECIKKDAYSSGICF